LVFAVVVGMMVSCITAFHLPRGLKATKKMKEGPPRMSPTCDGPALAVFDRFAKAYLAKNLTLVASYIDDSFMGNIAVNSCRWLNKAEFITLLNQSMFEHGAHGIFETERMDGGRVGAIKFHNSGFSTPTSDSIYNFDIAFYFAVNDARTQLIQAVELIDGVQPQSNQTQSIDTIMKLANASDAADAATFNATLSDGFEFFQYVCGGGEAASNRSGFMTDITEHFKQQAFAHMAIKSSDFIVNCNFVYVPFTNFFRGNSAVNGYQMVVDVMTFWELDSDFKVKRLVEFLSVFTKD